MRERPNALRSLPAAVCISIHAPLRERPADNLLVTAYDSDFNPRSLAGATLVTTVTSLLTSNFNPRSLAGATGNQKNGGRNCLHFNPRSLAGATLRNYDSKLEHFISIHAPSRERLNLHCYHSCAKIFQSTLPCGSDRKLQQALIKQQTAFQSTLPCGSDSTLINQLFGAKYFNPRSLAGATAIAHDYLVKQGISIHAPLRERPQASGLSRC